MSKEFSRELSYISRLKLDRSMKIGEQCYCPMVRTVNAHPFSLFAKCFSIPIFHKYNLITRMKHMY